MSRDPFFHLDDDALDDLAIYRKAKAEGQREGLMKALGIFQACQDARSLTVYRAALVHHVYGGEPVTKLVRRLGVSRKTFYKHLRRVRLVCGVT